MFVGLIVKFVNLTVDEEKYIMETSSINKVLQLFNLLSKPEQLEIADRIDKQTFMDRWQLIDGELPDVIFSDEEIMNEIRAVRYGDKKD